MGMITKNEADRLLALAKGVCEAAVKGHSYPIRPEQAELVALGLFLVVIQSGHASQGSASVWDLRVD